MCGVAEVGLALTGISTLMGVGGTIMQGNAQKAQAQAAAAQARSQQAIAEQQAQNEIQKGIAEDARFRRQAAAEHGELVSLLASSGFEMDSGSALQSLLDSRQNEQYESNLILNNANQSAWSALVGANNAGNSASSYDSAASNSGPATWMSAGGSLLGGLGTMGMQYSMYQASKSPDNYTYDGTLKNNPFTVKKTSFTGWGN